MLKYKFVKCLVVISLFVVISFMAMVGCQNGNGDGSGGPIPGDDDSDGGGPTLSFKGIGIDYDPEARCADNVTDWMGSPVACNPQPAFSDCNTSLSLCPNLCQACYNGDLNVIKSLGVGAIIIYQPNIYILTAAQSAGIKVILGTFNDAIPSLAMPDSETDCTYAGAPLFLCGSKYAEALIFGACIDTTPWPSNPFCGNHCSNDPNTLCSSNSDCSGGGTCLQGAFVADIHTFFENGTIIGIQLGNEFFNGSNAGEITTAAQTLRSFLNTQTFKDIPIIVSLIAGQGSQFCSGGAPPAGVDLIATHPYCNFVASVPPSWPLDGDCCFIQIQNIFSQDANSCGKGNTFIGETGYNTGCPTTEGTTHITDADIFIQNLVTWQCGNLQTNPQCSALPSPAPVVTPPTSTFLFAFVDACPPGGCQPGCSGNNLPNIGNGYFGLYFTEGYQTEGTLMPKFSTTPTLTCQ
ncbi:MAG TPA: hypothetical protein VH878_09525, partial [Thermodesulfobacteriota bacterium]